MKMTRTNKIAQQQTPQQQTPQQQTPQETPQQTPQQTPQDDAAETVKNDIGRLVYQLQQIWDMNARNIPVEMKPYVSNFLGGIAPVVKNMVNPQDVVGQRRTLVPTAPTRMRPV